MDELTVTEHVRLVENLTGQSAPPGLLSNVLLEEHANKRVEQLSGGMKRRLSMAMALIGNPAVLILDGKVHCTSQFVCRSIECQQIRWVDFDLLVVRSQQNPQVESTHAHEECCGR
jgi:ABC-type taurine transport system ATPase subunit